MAIHWVVYSREGCSLCNELLVELAELLGAAAAQVVVIDIGDDPELERKYGQRVPVLMADGEFVCAYRLHAQRVRGYLEIG